MPSVLIEDKPHFSHMQLVEGSGGRLIARGEFGRVDVPTSNGRIYPRGLMEREFKKLSENISQRRVLGELDHPNDGKTSLKRVSHVITKLEVREDGVVIGEAEILNTAMGKELRALIEGGVQVGVSSRGYGSTRPSTGKDSGEEVQPDFVLKTYDFVGDPAVSTALPSIVREDINDDVDPGEMFLAEFPEIAEGIRQSALEEAKASSGSTNDAPPADESVRAELSENFSRMLSKAILDAKSEISSELREQYEGDPEIGGAKAVLSQVAELVSSFVSTPDEKTVAAALKAKDLEVSEALAERDRATEMARSAAHALHVERAIGKHPMAESMRKILNGRRFESVHALQEALDTILADMPMPGDDGRISEAEAQLREDNADLRGKVNSLTTKVEELESKLRRAVKLGERIDEQRGAASLRAEEAERALQEANERFATYKEESELAIFKHEKVAGLANGRELLSLMEGVNSRAVVEKLVSGRGSAEIADGELREMRRSRARGVSEPPHELTENKLASGNDPLVDMEKMLILAGIE